MTSPLRSRALGALFCLSAFAPVIRSLPAQGSTAPADRKGWRVLPEAALHSEYDDNVFLLTKAKKSDLDPPSAASLASGRYENMKSAGDVITTLEGTVRIQGSGMGGRRFELSPRIAYEYYAANAERRNLTIGAVAEQSLGSDGRVRLALRSTPGYFAKNYLSDAVDADASGTISSAERVYKAGTYSEMDMRADYRRRLRKSDQGRIQRVLLDLGAGYTSRAYKAPFSGRDLSGPTADAGLRLDLRRKIDILLDYELALLSADAVRQVQLLDEPDFNRDFNGNATQTDLNVRTFELVDRSRTEQAIGVTLQLPMSAKTDVDLSYGRRFRSFGSTQPFDAGNRGRRDARNELGAELNRSLRSGLRLSIMTSYASQSVNRSNDAAVTGDVEDYTKLRFSAGLNYRF